MPIVEIEEIILTDELKEVIERKTELLVLLKGILDQILGNEDDSYQIMFQLAAMHYVEKSVFVDLEAAQTLFNAFVRLYAAQQSSIKLNVPINLDDVFECGCAECVQARKMG